MHRSSEDAPSAALAQEFRCLEQGAARGDDVIDDDRIASRDITDHLQDLGLLRPGPLLGNDREPTTGSAPEFIGSQDCARIGRHDHEVA